MRAQQPLPSIAGTGARAVIALAATLGLAPTAVHAADIYPPNPPRQIYAEDSSSAAVPNLPPGMTKFDWTQGSTGVGTSSDAVSCGGGFWGTHLVQTQGLASNLSAAIERPHPLGPLGTASVFVVDESVSGNPSYIPTDWDEFRFEFDFSADANSAVGVVWGGKDPDADRAVDHGYLFYIDQLPTPTAAADDGDRARWHLVRRQSGYDLEVASGEVELNGGSSDLLSVYSSACYRLRLDFFCGTLRVQIARINCGAGDCTVTRCGGGADVCTTTDYDSCTIEWCTVLDWIDPDPLLVPGFVGPFAGGIDTTTPAVTRFDNLVASTWDYTCADWCAAWDSWGDSAVEPLDMKFLYTGSLIDWNYGYVFKKEGYIDTTVKSGPTTVTLLNGTDETRDNCGGWTVLNTNVEKPVVDLPSWDNATSNLNELLAYLEPMASSVKLVYDSSATPNLSFVDDFDNRRDISGVANPDFNPNPLPTRGATPINAALTDAFDWYVNHRTATVWADDPLESCRLWYVILITDGEESCESDPAAVCAAGQAAEKFADPAAYGAPGVDPVKVYTVGFSESVAPTSPLRCVADITEGQFYSATDAGQLYDVLSDVFERMEDTDRSFIPYVVAPPPPSAAGQLATDEQFLTVFPHFIPRNQQTIWDGDLFAFALDQNQTTLPLAADCSIDTGAGVWMLGGSPAGANDILANQISTLTRNVYMGTDASGSWVRHAITDVFSNATLRTEFRALLDGASGSSDLEAVEVVNFVRDIYANPGALSLSPAPQDPPRPTNYTALGDIYHSQPVVVNPPNSYLYFSDYGLGPAHDYLSFRTKHAKRRRAVLAGANDGQLHAFDGGFFDRDDGGTFDDRHDLGTGRELFAFMPEAITDRLLRLTYGTEHQYMVDGSITVGDVFIDHDGDSNREWRTVALSTLRRGGRGVLALDITTPDPVLSANDWTPPVSTFPGCLDGTASGCDAEYPHLLWEFHDVDASGNPVDADGGYAAAVAAGNTSAVPEWFYDLGWTWSKPAIARIGIYALDGTGNVVPDDVFVAFFGGGWDRQESDYTGTHFYGVNIETGEVLVKELIGVSVPGGPTVLDSDSDGFHDRVYFGDSNGSIWRLQYPSPFLNTATGADAGTLRRIADFSGALTTANGRQQFFYAPTVVPVLFDGTNYTFALAIGAGDRANLGDDTADVINHFYVVVDDLDNDTGTNPAYTESNLIYRDWSDLNNDFNPDPGNTVCTDSAFSSPNKGWYLSLREDEKVNYRAVVFAGHVYFTSFEPGEGLTASNPPEICTPSTPPTGTPTPPVGTPTPTPTPDPSGGGANDFVCKASGIGRVYDLGITCGLGDYTEVNDILTGLTTYTIGTTTQIVATGSTGLGGGTTGGGVGFGFQHAILSSTTNWRQE